MRGSRIALAAVCFSSLSVGVASGGLVESPLPDHTGRLIVADFNHSGWLTNLGDPFGGWDHDPDDHTQFCRIRLVDEPRIGAEGFSLRMDYDVDSPNPAFNGFWMKLPSLELRAFRTLSFDLKGDAEHGYPKRLKLELKGRRGVASFILNDIRPDWVRVRIPLYAFRGIEKIRSATEFVVVFDDQTVTQLTGTIYLDEVAFESAP